MCGILGCVRDSSQLNSNFDPWASLEAMAHRGPDDRGIWTSQTGVATLGHLRLSIIDLSHAGHQPMTNEDGTIWITFNGELYNFAEMRPELEALGHRFRSNSDTEVVVHSYEEWGPGCLDRFRGFWSFAIWDEKRQRLFAARDRLGKKPFYFSHDPATGFVFGSELKGLLASGSIKRALRPEALVSYLSNLQVPAPLTMLAGVNALPPATWLCLSEGQIETQRYWSPPVRRDRNVSFQDAAQQTRQLLETSVRYRLVADVPVGAFLSGGVDSAIVVGLMSQLTSRPIQTFTVGFDGDDSAEDERPAARETARRLGTDHREIEISGKAVAAEIERIVDAIDQPSVEAINTYLVSKSAAGQVKVVLTGAGGDELFWGYRSMVSLHRLEPLAGWWRRLPNGLHGSLLGLSGRMPGRLGGRLARTLQYVDNPARLRTFNSPSSALELLRPDFAAGLLGTASDPLVEGDLDARNGLTALETAARADLLGYLPNMLLRDIDAVTMAHSLEARAPFLDHELVEFAFSLPSSLHVYGGTGKRVLMEACKDLLPAGKPARKRGFDLPFDRWLRNELRPMVEDAISARSITQRGLFDWAAVHGVWQQFLAGREKYQRIWGIVIFELWARRYLNE